ncbi:MAG: FHA domain-containing protein [Anaerolineales bacterium]|nr:FHA domain-containing protein [Anaerolineales bacterium]
MSENAEALAKLIWENPEDGKLQEYILSEGALVSLGRSPDNEVYIPERTVSRHHATIAYRAGVFVISDPGSANGVFVNDLQIKPPQIYPLIDGDVIRLYMPIVRFVTFMPVDTEQVPKGAATTPEQVRPRIVFTSGVLSGSEVVIEKEAITLGRAITNATWEVSLPDHAVSRPHARIYGQGSQWYLEDLGSVNGTLVEGTYIHEPILLHDGIRVTMGETSFTFRNPQS